jgi:hypothetical protein
MFRFFPCFMVSANLLCQLNTKEAAGFIVRQRRGLKGLPFFAAQTAAAWSPNPTKCDH